MKYSDFFHTKSRESFCFLKNSQELIILPLAKESKKKVWFFSPRIFRSLVHATNKKGIIENIVHAFYPLNKKYTFFWSKSMCSFWGSSRGLISPIWGKIVWKMLLKGLFSKIFIFVNLQREDKRNILKYYCTDNRIIFWISEFSEFKHSSVFFHVPTKILVMFWIMEWTNNAEIR